MAWFEERISHEAVETSNAVLGRAHDLDFEALCNHLDRRGIDIERVIQQAARFELALPSWGFAQGGTRFGRFPARHEPVTLEEKFVAASWINDLTAITPRVSLHIPWDRPVDVPALKRHARRLGLGFDAMNSNTFQDNEGPRSYKFGSLGDTDEAVRAQAIDHNIECIKIGELLGSKGLTVWLADGGSFPGQQDLRKTLQRVIDSLSRVSEALPAEWRLFVEYKPFEPAFYSTTVQDWGTALMICKAISEQVFTLVDLGHHLPNTNIEMVVARLIEANRLGGFHFNDSKFADDDLSAGSVKPYQLFLIFNELVGAQLDGAIRKRKPQFRPAYMLDQSHNLKDPIEDMISSAIEVHRAYLKALLVNRAQIEIFQLEKDVVMAERQLQGAFNTDVSPILAEVRRRAGGALDPILAYREFCAKRPSVA